MECCRATAMQELEMCFKKANEDNSQYIVVFISLATGVASEMIINQRCNFEDKLKYYKEAYDENLIHKFANEISITDFMAVKSLKELANRIEGKDMISTLEMDLKVNGINMFKADLENIEQTLDRIINKYEYVQEKVTKPNGVI